MCEATHTRTIEMNTKALHTRRGTTAAIALAAVVLTAAILAGCSNSTGPEPPSGSGVHYFARTSPDSVVANLRLAYENQQLSPYLDCLAEDFTFYPSESTLAEHEWIPESWGKIEEHRIHQNMFVYHGFVHDIILDLLQEGEPVEIPGPNPEDPVTYEYTFGVDLRVNCQDSLQYVATAPSLFVLQVDQDPVMPTTWGELKAIFLDFDLD